jgi:hypothetical protein
MNVLKQFEELFVIAGAFRVWFRKCEQFSKRQSDLKSVKASKHFNPGNDE